jgi:hypothetical protein
LEVGVRRMRELEVRERWGEKERVLEDVVNVRREEDWEVERGEERESGGVSIEWMLDRRRVAVEEGKGEGGNG